MKTRRSAAFHVTTHPRSPGTSITTFTNRISSRAFTRTVKPSACEVSPRNVPSCTPARALGIGTRRASVHAAAEATTLRIGPLIAVSPSPAPDAMLSPRGVHVRPATVTSPDRSGRPAARGPNGPWTTRPPPAAWLASAMTHCHDAPAATIGLGEAAVVLVGNSNVGKSAIFAALTGRRVGVSNYPGTTVEIATGAVRLGEGSRTLVDTPGVRSTMPLSDDERVTRDALIDLDPSAVVQVVDAKNLRRGLLLTFELAETGLPVVLCLNMTDEAEARGIHVDARKLSHILGVPVVQTIAVRRTGIERLREALAHAA